MKNITAITLIIASIVIFFTLIQPTYGRIQNIRMEEKEYAEALKKVDILNQKIEEHQATISAFDPADLEKLNKMLPDTVDNVRLVIDIDNVASNFGLLLKEFDIVDPNEEEQSTASVPQFSSEESASEEPYYSIDLSFNVTSSYANFISFIKALEKSLRIVDIVGISFEPAETGDIYDFRVTLRTYWLK